jgi:probable HAF family extracellular repeat protein
VLGEFALVGSTLTSVQNHQVLGRKIMNSTIVKSSKNALTAIVTAGSLLAISPQASAAYDFTLLKVLPGGKSNDAYGINNLGQIVGESDSQAEFRRPVLWNGTTPTDLGILQGGYAAAAEDINDTGQIAGWSNNGNFEGRAVRWHQGTTTDLGESGAAAINASGQIAGNTFVTSTTSHATLWTGNTRTDLGMGTLGGAAFANGINDAGQVVGFSRPANSFTERATLWNGTTATDLGTLSGGTISRANDINNAGRIVGYSASSDGDRAALWTGGTVTALGTLGGTRAEANAINEAGQIVGQSTIGDDIFDWHATLWNGTTAVDLNNFLDSETRAAGWVLMFANDINDNGAIVGTASNKNLSIYEDRAFLLTPAIPEPETYALLLAGLGLIALMARRRRQA